MGKIKKAGKLKWILAAVGTAGSAFGLGWISEISDKVPTWMAVTTGTTLIAPALALLSGKKKLKTAAIVALAASAGANGYMWLNQFGVSP